MLCTSSLANTKTVFAQVAGLAQFDRASLALGNGFGSATTNGTATISYVQPGPQDLLAYLTGNAGADRLIIRRDLDVAASASLGTIDFASAEAVAPALATVIGTSTNRSATSAFCAEDGFTRQSVRYGVYP